ncbi:hypothetical protein ACJRO7_024678 [Eucalyptus globulus]|uniref:Bifunctional inhibitor/plant lipid transfer protein/seed storage helical domain-containing protein n=1 Tax=Eucalyptus globulus TaxID=34317 RepID=A0ABD3KBP2_EUCGL
MAKPSNPSPSPRLLVAALMAVLLSSCVPAMTSSAQPSALCCSKMREQRPCLCGYIRNPNLRKYLTSADGKRVMRVCGVPYPTC